jgi:L-lactate dehydrogenase complex protein LldF
MAHRGKTGSEEARNFRRASAKAVADEVLVAAVRKTADILASRRAASLAGFADFEALRDWGRARKEEVSARIEEYARDFAEQLESAGGVVHFARNAADAAEAVMRIAWRRGARTAVKSKSMTAEEVSLNEALFAAGVQVTETDLGEFIIQLAGEKPSHILAPSIHKDRFQVGRLFHEALGTPPGLDVEDLVAAARKALRERFLIADLGITGANFGVAETGTLVLVNNEGNGWMTTSLPPVHVAIMGIDKIIPNLSDLNGFLTLLTRSASGQTISSYVNLITGPRRPGEEEGPEELHVVLLDNGRSALAGGPFREILHCLHCGACLNVCPVYRTVGGHAYESVYPGPMGGVLSPLLWGMAAYPDLPDACTLCGRCTEVCPVRIPLPDYHRELRVLRTQGRPIETLAATASAATAIRSSLYRCGVGLLRSVLREPALSPGGKIPGIPCPSWTGCRDLPRPQAGPDFRSWWQARKGSYR